MKKILSFSILFQLFFALNLKAGHVGGGEITYVCQGNGSYLVTVSFYRDCNGLPAPVSVNLNIENSCGVFLPVVVLQALSLAEITTCQPTTCNGGQLLGLEKCIYEGIVTLPSTCAQWTLSAKMAGRNPGINTLDNPSSYNLYLEATLNNENGLCENSPVFLNDPIATVCRNEPACIDPGIFDSEGDSLAAFFIHPRSESNVGVPYSPGFSILNPLTLDTPLTINSASGIYCFTPTALSSEISTIAIQVNQYRNDTLIGSIMRDMYLFVVQCIGTQPQLTGINGTTTNDTTICANTNFCFTINSNDSSLNDSTTLWWDEAIPSASFQISPSQYESAQFCWTPNDNDISPQPHCFSAFVKNDQCPVNRRNYRTYCITVVDSATCLTLDIVNPVRINSLKIYPQPVNNNLTIEIPAATTSIEILDITGRILFNKKLSAVTNEKIELSTDFLIDGMYLIRSLNKNGEILGQGKFLKAE